MITSKTISIGNVAYVLGSSVKKIHRWFQEVLSGFRQAEQSGEIGKDDFEVEEDGAQVEIKVPIICEENLGEQMAVDDKTINGTCYTVLSNRQTNKIAMMASTLKSQELMSIMCDHFDVAKRMQVKSLSRDMAQNYDWFGRQAFMNAYHVADKFHVVKHMIEQLQAVRIRYRQEQLAKQRALKEQKKPLNEVVLSNGDSLPQLLARSRGLLFIPPHKWSPHQRRRAKLLFHHYPEIKKTYDAVQQLRRWYRPPKGATTYQKTKDRKRKELKKMIKDFDKSDIVEIQNIAQLLKNHSGSILNYFIKKETNAKAEALNRNLQRFVNVNYS